MMRTIIVSIVGVLVAAVICSAAVAPADLTKTIDAHYAAVSALGMTPDGTALFSAGLDGRIKLWDTTSRPEARVVDSALVGFNHPDQQPDHAAGRVELAAAFALRAGELRSQLTLCVPPVCHVAIRDQPSSPEACVFNFR